MRIIGGNHMTKNINTNTETKYQNIKKRKTHLNKDEKTLKFKQNMTYFANLSNDEKERVTLIAYIKTFFEIYKTIPNIISILDRIIEKRATTIFPTSTIYGSPHSTYSEINKVIDLTERKDKLINLHIIADNMLNSLKPKYKEIAYLKYVKKLTVDEIAINCEKCQRSIYRTLSTINNEILKFLKVKNWTIDFLKQQIGKESWIEEIFQSKLQLQIENEIKSNYNNSSSSTIS